MRSQVSHNSTRRRRKGLAVTTTLLFHVAVLGLLMRSHPPVVIDAPQGAVDVSLAGPDPWPASTAADSKPPPPIPPSPPDPPVRPLVDIAIADVAIPVALTVPQAEPVLDRTPPSLPVQTISSSAPAASGKPCEIVADLQSELQKNPTVREALARIPREKRSVAGAVMLWNQTWAPPDSIGGAATMAPIQSAIVQVVATAEPHCQSETVLGPRLLIVGDTRGTVILALGSGQWRWLDLLPQTATSPTPFDQLFKALGG